MNLKSRKTATVASVEGDLLEKAFDEKDNSFKVNLSEVDTSDLETSESDSINEFLDSLPPADAFSENEEVKAEEPIEEEIKAEKKKSVKTQKKTTQTVTKAEEFKKIRKKNEETFKKFLNEFQQEVEENDADSFEINSNKSFLTKMFEAEGFEVEKTKSGIIVRF